MDKNLFLSVCFYVSIMKNEYKNSVQIDERLKTRFFSIIRLFIVSYQIGNE